MNFFATRQADGNLGLRHIFEHNRSEAHRPFFILTAGGAFDVTLKTFAHDGESFPQRRVPGATGSGCRAKG
jgi:hypothetical protein